MATSDDGFRDFAKKKLKAKQDFKSLVAVWFFVVGLTSTVWFLTSPGSYYWPIWVAFGVGIAVVVSGYEAYGRGLKRPITDEDIDAEVARLKKNSGK
ncbi:MAG TPA: 2TM domain-containing protein [Microbacteriaceae bacterium]